MGNVLMNLVNTHTGGPGNQVGASCPEVGSTRLSVGCSDWYLLETHREVRSEGCWGCWREASEMDDGLALHPDATQVPCPVGGWQRLLELRAPIMPLLTVPLIFALSVYLSPPLTLSLD